MSSWPWLTAPCSGWCSTRGSSSTSPVAPFGKQGFWRQLCEGSAAYWEEASPTDPLLAACYDSICRDRGRSPMAASSTSKLSSATWQPPPPPPEGASLHSQAMVLLAGVSHSPRPLVACECLCPDDDGGLHRDLQALHRASLVEAREATAASSGPPAPPAAPEAQASAEPKPPPCHQPGSQQLHRHPQANYLPGGGQQPAAPRQPPNHWPNSEPTQRTPCSWLASSPADLSSRTWCA